MKRLCVLMKRNEFNRSSVNLDSDMTGNRWYVISANEIISPEWIFDSVHSIFGLKIEMKHNFN